MSAHRKEEEIQREDSKAARSRNGSGSRKRTRNASRFAALIAGCLIALSAALSGCAAEGDDARGLNPAGGGYVVNVDDGGRILVVSPVKQDFGANGGDEAYYEAIWYALPEDYAPIEVGMEVNVWVEPDTVVMETYPGQTSAVKVDVHEDPRPEGAKLARSEAVSRALDTLGEDAMAPVVLDADYDADRGVWTVKLLDDRRDPVGAEIEG